MPVEVIFGFILDVLLGDPRWLPHPVKLMGKAVSLLERILRRLVPWERLAGMLLVLVIVAGSFLLTAVIVTVAYAVHPTVGLIVASVAIWTTLAVKDLAAHANRVVLPLMAGNLARARNNLALIVGRDTQNLDEDEVVRACVETVAENTVDGILSPLFFAFIGGAPLAMAFKAVSTLDSMVGHKTEQYIRFGWAAARLDDVANWIPARMCAVLMPLASLFCDHGFLASWRTMWRDRRKHESPNAGIPEAAMAGALRVQLGGVNYYDGEPHVSQYQARQW
jgi:adenosylcobinamide-phosphate synthase